MPLVSCVLPTRGRSRTKWASQSVECFLRQRYENKELLILDDEDDPSFSTPPHFARYLIGPRWTIGRKHNELAVESAGVYIAHFDSDDWSHPDRLMSQVKLLQESRRHVAGFNSMLFVNESEHRAWKYIGGRTDYAVGTSLMYAKSFWKQQKFLDKQGGGDEDLARIAREQNQLIAADGHDLMVARIHSGNTSPKNPNCNLYHPIEWNQLPEEFLATTISTQ